MVVRQIMDGSNGVLNLRAVLIHWGEEAGPEGGGGATSVTHLRWMLHPRIGLPVNAFQVFRAQEHRDERNNPSKQWLAENSNWEEMEVVGLPVDTAVDSWRDTTYRGLEQGKTNSHDSPMAAALARLKVGAPRRGWVQHDWNGIAGPAWQDTTDLDAYLNSVTASRLWNELGTMSSTIDPAKQLEYTVAEPPHPVPNPALILDPSRGWMPRAGETSTQTWQPMKLLTISASSDPLAALALGYGSAYLDASEDWLWMVSIRQLVDGREIEVADIAKARVLQWQGLAPPAHIRAVRTRYTRPQVMDGPSMETVGITWDRPTSTWDIPLVGAEKFPAEKPQAVAYAIAQYDQQGARLFLERREGGGFLSYVSAVGNDADKLRCIFNDHLKLDRPLPQAPKHHYAVAGQDLYGRWSKWADADYVGDVEKPQDPAIISATLTTEGKLTVDFSWDWSDRSPEYIHLAGQYDGDPAVLVNGRVKFQGADQGRGVFQGEFIPLKADGTRGGWGAEQDNGRDPVGVRLYRWTVGIDAIEFQGKPSRSFRVTASGQCHLHELAQPGWNGNSMGVDAYTTVWDPRPPTMPLGPPLEVPSWASLPDAAGVSRFNLHWPSSPEAENGYLIYEATETAVRAAFDIAEPLDLAIPVTKRLNDLLLIANFAAKRDALKRTFRMINRDPVPREQLAFEVTLPRGSQVLHFFTVTAVGGNRKESPWPEHKNSYTAVAVPRTATPLPPSISVTPAGTELAVQIGRLGASGGIVELYRLTRDLPPDELDAMGPPINRVDAPADVLDVIDNPSAGWQKVWYGATVRSRPDISAGIVSIRSPASALVYTLVPPTSAPALTEFHDNEPGSSPIEGLASWRVTAPLSATAFGPHLMVAEIRAEAGGEIIQIIEKKLDEIPVVAGLNDVALPTGAESARLLAVREGAGHRIYCWVQRNAGESRHLTVKLFDPLNRLTVLAADIPSVVYARIDWQKNAEDMRGQNGMRFYYELDPAPGGPLPKVWGTDTYTDDSPIAAAAVHAGMLTTAGGRVVLEIRPGEQSYAASSRHGVESATYGPWPGSYVFVRT